MKRLFISIVICFVLMGVTLAVIWCAPGTVPHDLAALVNKKEMLKSKPSPRMIFVGGSSVLSLKSPQIEKELKYSVINMSLWGGLATMKHLEEIKPFLRAGDVVVVTMEYGTILDDPYMEYTLTNDEGKKFFFLMAPDRHIPIYIKKKDFCDLIKIIHELSQMKVKSFIRNLTTLNLSHLFDTGFPNYQEEFNSDGDRVKPYMIFRPLQGIKTKFNYPNKKNILFLNDFCDFASERKARVFFYFSHFPAEQYRTNEKYINAYYDLMKASFRGTLLNRPPDFKYPEEYFADTIYHLNDKGETIRTAELIKMLKRAL
jgi:hypothetical protein